MPGGSIARSLCARIHTCGSSRRRRAAYEAIAVFVVLIAFGLVLI